MTKRSVIHCIFSILLAAYLAAALFYAFTQARIKPYAALEINVDDSHALGFVTVADIDATLDSLQARIGKMPADSVSLRRIESSIENMDNIENANCMVLNNRVVRVDVVPLQPIARVFDDAASDNYYINRAGKKMQANSTFRIDVPVITGRFAKRSPLMTLPLLDYLARHPDMAALVSCISVRNNGDICLVPMVRGHIVNIGDASDIDDKMSRLRVFYRDVLPVKGWEYYDTISVKWRGQVVARRRFQALPAVNIAEEDDPYIDSEETMDAGLGADGRSDNLETD